MYLCVWAVRVHVCIQCVSDVLKVSFNAIQLCTFVRCQDIWIKVYWTPSSNPCLRYKRTQFFAVLCSLSFVFCLYCTYSVYWMERMSSYPIESVSVRSKCNYLFISPSLIFANGRQFPREPAIQNLLQITKYTHWHRVLICCRFHQESVNCSHTEVAWQTRLHPIR